MKSIDQFTLILQATPLQLDTLTDCLADNCDNLVTVARFDQIDPCISGNKAFKLLPHLVKAEEAGKDRLISFGGMFSNHLHALAFAGKQLGIKTLGVVRAYEGQPESITLQEARKAGMKIIKIGKTRYRHKHSLDFQRELLNEWPNAYIIPEGGGGREGIDGASLMAKLLQKSCHEPYDYILMPVGTGTTLAGFLQASKQLSIMRHTKFVGIAALNDKATMIDACQKVSACSDNWLIMDDYCFGGFAKVNAELAQFMLAFEQRTGLMLDPVYTAKMFFAVKDLMSKGFFKPGSRILCIHTGGLQGRRGLIEKLRRLSTPNL